MPTISSATKESIRQGPQWAQQIQSESREKEKTD